MSKEEKEELNIKFASQVTVKELEPWITKILNTLGHPEAWVSDESKVVDFLEMSWPDDSEKEKEEVKENNKKLLAKMSKEFGFEIKSSNYLTHIAFRLSTLEK